MKVFISYASEDSVSAKKIYTWLKNHKRFEPWIDRENLLAGSNWELQILTSIKLAKAIILLISENSITKVGYVQKEIKEALKRFEQFPPGEIFIIPVRINNVELNYPELEKIHRIDMFKGWDNGFKKLSQALDKIQPGKPRGSRLPKSTYQVWEGVESATINELYKNGAIEVPQDVKFSDETSLFLIKNGKKSALAFNHGNKLVRIGKVNIEDIRLLNAEQVFFAWLLRHNEFKIVLLLALSGTGKTLLTAGYLASIAKRRRVYIVGDTTQARKVWEQFNKLMDDKGRPIKENRAFRVKQIEEFGLHDLNHATIVGCFDNTLTPTELKQMLVQLQDTSQFILLAKYDLKSSDTWATYLHDKLHGTEIYHHVVFSRIQRSEISTRLNELL